ncbi:hypothetical protein ATANTOWER_013527 [Ataeniobius toweri]|uniref:Uncharacterized protein n=1 Tax=Ataeniobius toweri TaxID=208326 RepID=A0ABU7B8Q0_9TELE|nr:hypothetical protein [Ataeniobius toweri]
MDLWILKVASDHRCCPLVAVTAPEPVNQWIRTGQKFFHCTCDKELGAVLILCRLMLLCCNFLVLGTFSW